MKVKKALNNNVVIAFEPKRGEIVVMGTGIGFHAKQGDLIDESKIQKIFTESENKKLIELIEQIPASYLELTEKIVTHSTQTYQMKLQEGIYLLLTDHIYFALKRIQEGWDIDNPFLIDIKHFYKEEYQIGLYAKEEIKRMYQVEIPETEVGYISMHIVQSRFNQDRKDFTKIFQVINTSVDFLKENLPSVEEDTLSYMRMINHVKHFAKRYVENKENDTKDNTLSEIIQGAFKEEVNCVNKLSKLLLKEFGREITVSEKNYLVLHLRNCKEILD
jgi:beta-glucoside operon transcriptional antiterminator